MKLKQQSRPPRATPPKRPAAKPARGSRRGGRQARKPSVPLRARLAGRLPSLRRVLTGLGAAATGAVLVALVNGPWLRVSDVAWAGDRYTEAREVEGALEGQRGLSLLAVDTRAVRERIERIPSVAKATVTAELTGRVRATIVEREPAFVWETSSSRFIGAADGTIFAGEHGDAAPDDGLEGIPHVRDERFAARLITVGDVIPDALLRTALRISEIDPLALGSDASGLTITLDDEFGFRLVSDDPAWEVALGVYGLDPRESVAEADARLDQQITAVRTLFASRPESEIGWVDVRNPGKVYFRAKG